MNHEILVGIIAGILTSIVVWMAVKFFNNVVLPSYEVKTYKGIKINGSWGHVDHHTEDGKPVVYEDTLQIVQRGYSISGTYTCRNQRPEYTLNTIYSISGYIQDNYVLINYRRKDNIGTGIGSFLLKIIGNSDVLEGGVAFIELRTTKVLNYGNVVFEKL